MAQLCQKQLSNKMNFDLFRFQDNESLKNPASKTPTPHSHTPYVKQTPTHHTILPLKKPKHVNCKTAVSES